MKPQKEAGRYAQLLLGAAILAFGLFNVHQQSRITEGGVLGATLLLQHWLGISPAISEVVMDVACYLLGIKYLGKSFLRYSLVATGGFAVFYALFARMGYLLPSMAHLPLLAAVVGGLFVGVGVGLVVRAGGAQAEEGARTKLIEHNLRLVAHIVRKYYSAQGCSDDLISIGTIGLIKAIDSFNPEKGARFATYSAKCIQNEILMYFRSQKKNAYEVSINETIDTDRDGNPLTYIDIIRVEDTIADDIDTKIKTDRAMEFIRTNLDRREKQIISMRYGLGRCAPITQREVAAKLGISRSYISRIEKSALAKISEYLK